MVLGLPKTYRINTNVEVSYANYGNQILAAIVYCAEKNNTLQLEIANIWIE